MLTRLRPDDLPLPEQIAQVKQFYTPILEKRYDQAHVRKRDIEQLEQISSNFPNRSTMLTELALDPPSGTQDLAGAAAARGGLPDPLDDPLRQRVRVGLRIRHPRRRWEYPVRHGHRL
jgi:hypothetical protein